MGWTTQYPATPNFVADWDSVARNTGGQIDWSNVPDSYRAGTTYTVAVDAALADATEVGVDPLPVALPSGTILYFGADKYVKLTAPADAGDETITVEALTTALGGTETATYLVSASGSKVIKAGTVLCQLTSGKYVPRAARPGSEEAVGLLISAATENSTTDALTGYGIIVGGVIYETLLPETITSYKTELGTNGLGWVWLTYADGRDPD